MAWYGFAKSDMKERGCISHAFAVCAAQCSAAMLFLNSIMFEGPGPRYFIHFGEGSRTQPDKGRFWCIILTESILGYAILCFK